MPLVKLESFEFVWEAELIRSLLESDGIQAFVFDAEHIRINWALSNALGGVRVMVNEIDLTQAQTIMVNWREGLYEGYLGAEEFVAIQENLNSNDHPKEEDWQISHCPQCGSKELSPIYNSLKTLIFFLLIGPAPGKQTGLKCKSCKHKHLY